MSYPNYKINFGEIIREYNRRRSKEWIEINQFCKRKQLDQVKLVREAFEHLGKEYQEMLRNPNTPDGIKALALLQRVMLELVKGMA